MYLFVVFGVGKLFVFMYVLVFVVLVLVFGVVF